MSGRHARRGMLLLLLTACVLCPGASRAMTWSYDWNRGQGTPGLQINDNAGVFQGVAISFDETTELFSWSSTFSPGAGGVLPDGGWLVVTEGPNAKGFDSVYAIFYADGVTGNLTTYVYDGASSSSSWMTRPFLQSDPGAVVAGGPPGAHSLSFQLDVGAILAAPLGPQWKGPAFTEMVGIWFHPIAGTQASYAADGSLLSWGMSGEGWFDGELPLPTTPTPNVPEPEAALLLLVAALGGALQRRRQAPLRRS